MAVTIWLVNHVIIITKYWHLLQKTIEVKIAMHYETEIIAKQNYKWRQKYGVTYICTYICIV